MLWREIMDELILVSSNQMKLKMNVHPYVASSSGTGSFHMNFGNNPTFNGLVSAGTETDGNSQ